MPDVGAADVGPADVGAELVVYGIPNCDQVKKAQRWFSAARQAYRFHDLRRDGLSPRDLRRWLSQHPWTSLVNQKGTTWRNLDPKERPADESSAIAAMLAHPTLIKRPVVERGAVVLVGFSEDRFAALLEGRSVVGNT